jgi:hypothetical protein
MTLSTNPKVYRFVQWVMFAPLLLPLCVVVGAVEGIQKMAGTVIEQFKADETVA